MLANRLLLPGMGWVALAALILAVPALERIPR